jgi:hypothetical protein
MRMGMHYSTTKGAIKDGRALFKDRNEMLVRATFIC